jgi:dTDP-4-dehydrorhamnose reductase
MLGLMAERKELSVVDAQVGTPTWANGLAKAIWNMIDLPAPHGIYHWTDAGVASWYDFAVAIQEESMALGLLQTETAIKPISSKEYQTLAQRPAYSVLDKKKTWDILGYNANHWRKNLRSMLSELKGIIS